MHTYFLQKLYFFPTPGFEDQCSREYKTKNIDDYGIERILRATNDGYSVTPTALGSVSSEFIELSSNANKNLYIPNGWAEPRFSFYSEIVIDKGHRNERLQIITGYTDKHDLSYAGTLDDDMLLFINNSIMIQRYAATSSLGNYVDSSTLSNDFMIRSAYSPSEQGVRQYQHKAAEVSLRSEDILYSAEMMKLMDPDNEGSFDRKDVWDGRSMISGDFKMARRTDGNVVDYASTCIISGIKKNLMLESGDFQCADVSYADPYFSNVKPSAYEEASQQCRAGDIAQHGIFAALNHMTDFSLETTVTLRDFVGCCDEADVPLVMSTGKVNKCSFGAEWGGSSYEDIVPDVVKNTILSVMMGYGIVSANVVITNQSRTRQLIASVTNAISFSNKNANRDDTLMEIIQDKLISSMGHIITQQYQVPITVSVSYKLTSGMNIEVDHHDGEGVFLYRAAIFADSVHTSLRSDKPEALDSIASDLMDLSDVIHHQRKRKSNAV